MNLVPPDWKTKTGYIFPTLLGKGMEDLLDQLDEEMGRKVQHVTPAYIAVVLIALGRQGDLIVIGQRGGDLKVSGPKALSNTVRIQVVP